MASRGFQALSDRRRQRALALSVRYPASRQALEFCAALASFQQGIEPRIKDWESLAWLLPDLRDWVGGNAPRAMCDLVAGIDQSQFREALSSYWERRDTSSLLSFFARAVLQPYAWSARPLGDSADPAACPRCRHLPQAGVLRPLGQGRALTMLCSLCLGEWPFRRGSCPSCGEQAEERQALYSSPALDHIQTQACETCGSYLHLIDLSRDGDAVPDVDELAALPLDAWAQQEGYHKRQPNLVGI